MDNEIDIYADLDTDSLEFRFSQLQEENEYLHKHISRLESDAEKFTGEINRLKETQDILTKNISELYNTAKNELQRKDRIINELRAQLNVRNSGFRGNKSREPEVRNIDLPNNDTYTFDKKSKFENNVIIGEKNDLPECKDKNDGKVSRAVEHKSDSDYHSRRNNFKSEDDKFSDTSQRGRYDRNERSSERNGRNFTKRHRSRSREFRNFKHFEDSRTSNRHNDQNRRRSPDRYEHRREYDRNKYKFERNIGNDRKRLNYEEKTNKSVETFSQIENKSNSSEMPEKSYQIKGNLSTDIQQNKMSETKCVSNMDVATNKKTADMKTPELLKESVFKKTESELLKMKDEILKSLDEGNLEQKRKRSKSLSPKQTFPNNVKKLKLETVKPMDAKLQADELKKDENLHLSSVVKKLQQRITPQLKMNDDSSTDSFDESHSKSYLFKTVKKTFVKKKVVQEKSDAFNLKKLDTTILEERNSNLKKPDLTNLDKGLPNLDKDLPNLDKDLPNLDKELPNLDKDLPNLDKDLPNLKKDLPNLEKYLPNLDKEDISCVKKANVLNLDKLDASNTHKAVTDVAKKKSEQNLERLDIKLTTPDTVLRVSPRSRRKVVVKLTQLQMENVREYTPPDIPSSDENTPLQKATENVLYTPQHSLRTRKKTPYKVKKAEETLLTKINTSLLSDEQPNATKKPTKQTETKENQSVLEKNSNLQNETKKQENLDKAITQISNTLSELDGKTPTRTEAQKKEQLKRTKNERISDLKKCLESPVAAKVESTANITPLISNKSEPPILTSTGRRRRRCVVKLKE